MTPLAPALERVIAELSKLPGIGRKTAQRLVFHLLKVPEGQVAELATSLAEMREKIGFCVDCHYLSEANRCPVCTDPRRDPALLCVVEEPANVLVLDRTGSHRGLYHVLGGALSPLRDIGPDDLHIADLVERVSHGEFREVILATNPNVEGEATAVYLSRLLKPLGVSLTRPAQGLPAGSDLEYTDDLTVQRAFEGRRDY